MKRTGYWIRAGDEIVLDMFSEHGEIEHEASPRGNRSSSSRSVGFQAMRVGSRGFAVTKAQHLLNAAGALPALVADGVFGPATRAAVVAFQARSGVTQDGILGPITGQRLVESIGLRTPATSASSLRAKPGQPQAPGAEKPTVALLDEPVVDCVYEAGEREESRLSMGPVEPSIVFGRSIDNGHIVQVITFSNFESARSDLKGAEHLGSLRPIIQAFKLDSLQPSHRVRLFAGYTDCVDNFGRNVSIRRSRALNTKLMFLDNGARSQNLGDAVAAPFGTEPSTNSTRAGRARNRSVRVIIERVGTRREEDTPAPSGCPHNDVCDCPSDLWELTGIAGGAFVIGVGVVVQHFVLFNVQQKRCYSFNFQGIGGGFGTGVSVSDFIFSKPTRFRTAPSVSIANFRNAAATIVNGGVSFGVAVDIAKLTFKNIRTDPRQIDIGGASVAGVEPKIGGGAYRADGAFSVLDCRRCS